MRLIDADNLQFGWCGSELCADPCNNCNKRTISKEDVDNAPTVEVPENTVNCVLTMFGKCSYNKTGCSDCEIKDKIRKALNERPI